jgi:hypothetical protein
MDATDHAKETRKYTIIASWLDGFGPPFMEFAEGASSEDACLQARAQIAIRRWWGDANALQLRRQNISIIDVIEGHHWELAR